jgi:hypothetical protein
MRAELEADNNCTETELGAEVVSAGRDSTGEANGAPVAGVDAKGATGEANGAPVGGVGAKVAVNWVRTLVAGAGEVVAESMGASEPNNGESVAAEDA